MARRRWLPRSQYRKRIKAMIDLIENHKPEGMTAFEMLRTRDETGVSKALGYRDDGVVLEGMVFFDGTIAIHWCSEAWSVVFYPDWRTFVRVHIGSHPTNGTIIRFYKPKAEGVAVDEWRQEDKQQDAAKLLRETTDVGR